MALEGIRRVLNVSDSEESLLERRKRLDQLLEEQKNENLNPPKKKCQQRLFANYDNEPEVLRKSIVERVLRSKIAAVSTPMPANKKMDLTLDMGASISPISQSSKTPDKRKTNSSKSNKNNVENGIDETPSFSHKTPAQNSKIEERNLPKVLITRCSLRSSTDNTRKKRQRSNSQRSIESARLNLPDKHSIGNTKIAEKNLSKNGNLSMRELNNQNLAETGKFQNGMITECNGIRNDEKEITNHLETPVANNTRSAQKTTRSVATCAQSNQSENNTESMVLGNTRKPKNTKFFSSQSKTVQTSLENIPRQPKVLCSKIIQTCAERHTQTGNSLNMPVKKTREQVRNELKSMSPESHRAALYGTLTSHSLIDDNNSSCASGDSAASSLANLLESMQNEKCAEFTDSLSSDDSPAPNCEGIADLPKTVDAAPWRFHCTRAQSNGCNSNTDWTSGVDTPQISPEVESIHERISNTPPHPVVRDEDLLSNNGDPTTSGNNKGKETKSKPQEKRKQQKKKTLPPSKRVKNAGKINDNPDNTQEELLSLPTSSQSSNETGETTGLRRSQRKRKPVERKTAHRIYCTSEREAAQYNAIKCPATDFKIPEVPKGQSKTRKRKSKNSSEQPWTKENETRKARTRQTKTTKNETSKNKSQQSTKNSKRKGSTVKSSAVTAESSSASAPNVDIPINIEQPSTSDAIQEEPTIIESVVDSVLSNLCETTGEENRIELSDRALRCNARNKAQAQQSIRFKTPDTNRTNAKNIKPVDFDNANWSASNQSEASTTTQKESPWINLYLNNQPCSVQWYTDSLNFDVMDNIEIAACSSNLNENSSSGYLKLQPLDNKERQITTKHSLYFTILEGIAEVGLQWKKVTLGEKSTFTIPKGCEYYIKNLSATDKLVLHFVRHSPNYKHSPNNP